jgi:uncharacterized protein with PQ loop repeat
VLDNNSEFRYTKGMKNDKTIKKLGALSGWAGMVLIHSATLPTTLGVILGYSDKTPPISMVILVWTGLMLFLFRAIVQKDTLYIVSNAVGFFFNSILLALIVFK